MNISSSKIVTPKYERKGRCRVCGNKLTIKENYIEWRSGKVTCTKCGAVNYNKRYIVY